MRSETIQLTTGARPVVHDLTTDCERFLSSTGVGDGLLSVFVPHATAGLAVIETGAGSEADLLSLIDRLLPTGAGWGHRHGSAGHGRDHVLPALISPSLTIPVLDGRMQLGTWQSVCLVDTNIDNARRTVRLSFLEG
ncbi:MAG TPA: secondary thiamine-phosphate synthase enzyme YjbQ, partial [Acidimicrobiales bacterium]|nr:secondary thiamine-phosphate synthase enzyme YjbQ [Acidimicrobiales bacterium]